MAARNQTGQETIQPKLQSFIEERMAAFSRELSRVVSQTATVSSSAQEIGLVARFARRAEQSTEQVAILERLVEDAARTGTRALLLVVKGGALRGWAARGVTGDFQVKSLTIPLTSDDLLGRAVETAAPVRARTPLGRAESPVADALGAPPPTDALAAPLWVKDRVVAVLYVDTQGSGSWQPEAAALMASFAALSLEALPYRTRYQRPEQPEEPAPDDAGDSEGTPGQPDPPMPAAATIAVNGSALSSIEIDPEGIDAPEPEDQRLHDEAKRFAALLVSEIVLYNEKQLEEGRRKKDLYERLKDDIDRSYRMFEQRVSSKLSGASRYFREEIVRSLAHGDESAIRLPWD